MYIAPQGTIYLLTGVPLDNTYEHTLYFSSKTEQYNYFYSKIPKKTIGGVSVPNPAYMFTNQTYIRKGRGVIRVQVRTDDLYKCNYLMFKNDGFNVQTQNAKWFYAFITTVEYVNNEVSDIYYEIDPMQTWFYAPNSADNDYELEQCYVEREHSATDNIGDNTVPEPVEAGEYSIYDTDILYWLDKSVSPPSRIPLIQGKYSAVIAAPWKVTGWTSRIGSEYLFTPTYQDAGSVFYGNQLSGLYYSVFDLTDYGSEQGSISEPAHDVTKLQCILNDTSADGTKRLQEIVAIYIVPTCMVSTPTNQPQSAVKYTAAEIPKAYAWGYKVGNTNKSVRNKKLYTAPYNILNMVSSDGDCIEYHYERFNSPSCIFSVEGVMGSPPQIQLVPFDYKMVAYDSEYPRRNYNESLMLENFGLCSWVTDTFRAWIAQNSSRLITKTITSAASSASQIISGQNLGIIADGMGVLMEAGSRRSDVQKGLLENQSDSQIRGGIISLADSVMGSLSEIRSASLMPDATHGVSKNLIGASNGELGYRYYRMRVKDENAAIIDSFFDRFGYATKMTKVPNINVRETWCYTKTKGCTISGSIPTTDAAKICSIYDKGITFWKSPSSKTVGDYSQSNDPI